jgi:hypothetical protein
MYGINEKMPLRILSPSAAPFRSYYAGLKTLLFVIIRDDIPPALVSILAGMDPRYCVELMMQTRAPADDDA